MSDKQAEDEYKYDDDDWDSVDMNIDNLGDWDKGILNLRARLWDMGLRQSLVDLAIFIYENLYAPICEIKGKYRRKFGQGARIIPEYPTAGSTSFEMCWGTIVLESGGTGVPKARLLNGPYLPLWVEEDKQESDRDKRQHDLCEGVHSKGGVNPPPTSSRPTEPPKGEGR